MIQDVLLRHIKQSQLSDGSFASLSAENADFEHNAKSYNTTFFTSWIALFLSSQKDTRAADIREKACSFLMSQKSPSWTWNYWSRSSTESTNKPYPDDADDTFCALAAIQSIRPFTITHDILETIAYQLTHIEEDTGGPYYTWYTRNKDWRQDIDVAVNANIGYFLHMHDIFLENLDDFLAACMSKAKLDSPYYPSMLMPAYFLSRLYRGSEGAQLESSIAAAHPSNPLETSIAVTALCNIRTPSSNKLALSLFEKIEPHSLTLCQPYAWCIDPAIEGKQHFAGASALTCAAYLEAAEATATIAKAI